MRVDKLPHFRADCHCHSHFSDGALSVEALLQLAKTVGLQGLAITDHDTIDAYETALPLAQENALSLVSGIEISAQYQGTSIHILGYAFDLKHPEMIALCTRQQAQRQARNLAILDKLKHINFEITQAELEAAFPFRSLGRPHIAQLMMQKGYVTSVKTAFERYLGEKKRCSVTGFDLSIDDAIKTIHAAQGFAVLAHPCVIKATHLLNEILNFPFDGIEVYYGGLPQDKELPFLKAAEKRGWFATGGSDFHGPHKAYAKLGSRFTPPDVFKQFEQRFENNQLMHTN